MTDASSLPVEPDDDWTPRPFCRQLPDHLTVLVDGLLPLEPDPTNRQPTRVVLTMPDYVADSLAHLLAYLSRITIASGGADTAGIHSASLAAALFGAAISGDYRCPEGALHLDRVSVDPEIMGGVPCISGTRIPVVTVAGMYAAGMGVKDIVGDFYPELSEADVRAAVDWPPETAADSEPMETT